MSNRKRYWENLNGVAIICVMITMIFTVGWICSDNGHIIQMRFWGELLYSLADEGDDLVQLVDDSQEIANAIKDALNSPNVVSTLIAVCVRFDIEQDIRLKQLYAHYPTAIESALDGDLAIANEILLKWTDKIPHWQRWYFWATWISFICCIMIPTERINRRRYLK